MIKQKTWWVCFVLLILAIPAVQAGADDIDPKERGVEWVKDYSGNPDGWGNLANTKDDAESFYNALGNLGWRRVFDYGDSLAWESDFEKSSVGGSDATYIDGLDFAYFSGHGTPTGFIFGTNHDGDGSQTYRVHFSEANWGDLDLEWIVLSACQVLQYDDPAGNVFNRWGYPVFKGLHMILGYDTIAQDSVIGGTFVNYMTTGGRKIKDAWTQANIDIQPSWAYSASLRGCNNDEWLPGYGSQGPDDDTGSCLVWARVQS